MTKAIKEAVETLLNESDNPLALKPLAICKTLEIERRHKDTVCHYKTAWCQERGLRGITRPTGTQLLNWYRLRNFKSVVLYLDKSPIHFSQFIGLLKTQGDAPVYWNTCRVNYAFIEGTTLMLTLVNR